MTNLYASITEMELTAQYSFQSSDQSSCGRRAIYIVAQASYIYMYTPYSRKIWQELNLADWPQPAKTKVLADFNLADG